MSKRSRSKSDLASPLGEVKRNKTGNIPERESGTDHESKGYSSQLKLNVDTSLSVEDLNKLGRSHFNQFRQLEEPDEIEKAIEYFSRVLDLTPGGHPELPGRFANLGAAYGSRFQRQGNLEDLEKAIEYDSHALNLSPEGHKNIPMQLGNLGASHTDRYHRLGELNDLEKAIVYESRALALTPDGHPDLPSRHSNLGLSYSDRFQRLGGLQDLETAIKHHSCALELTPYDHPDLPFRYANLGTSYDNRFYRLGDLQALETAINHHSHALGLTPDGHPDLPTRHASLGSAYIRRFKRLGNLQDLEQAIKHNSRALNLTPNDHPALSYRHAGLGVAYADRYHRLGELNDLEKVIEHESRALALTPDDHPNLSFRHSSLGSCYVDRFQRLGGLQDLETAIKHHSRALDLTPDDHPDLPSRHASLGSAYIRRFKRLEDLQDLEKAIEHQYRALNMTPSDHPSLPSRYSNLGSTYIRRFKRLGDLQDLEKGIKHKSRGLELTPNNHPDLPYQLAGLGRSYADRFQRLGNLQDLETAIRHKSHALELTPNDHPDLPYRHASLGGSYRDRFQRLDDLQDLEKAIKHDSRALELTPEDHPNLSNRLVNLAISYTDQFHRLHKLEDLERVIQLESRALALTPDGHPDLLNQYFNQALTFLLQYQHTDDPSQLNSVLDSFRKASQSASGSPRVKFRNALDWARHALTNGPLCCIEAYQTTIDLLPEFIWLGATTGQRYQDLSATENLAINAAYAAIRRSEHALALEWLEHARCVVWNQSLMLRSPLDQLQDLHPNLAARLQSTANQLNDFSSRSAVYQVATDDSVNSEGISQQRRQLAKEYTDLLLETRELPGFEDFLRPMKAKRLVCAARYGPIVVINCHTDRCDVLLMIPGQDGVKHFPLPNFNEKNARDAQSQIEKSLRHKRLRERGVRTWMEPEDKDRIGSVLTILWHKIVKPVLDFLGYTNGGTTGSLPHITWCPTGSLSPLPFHAAGDYDQTHGRVFEYAVSSYTPTLTALLASTPSLLEHPPRVLAIGQEYTPGHNPLPGTTRELELVQLHTHNKAEYSQLTGDRATTTAVLEAMDGHDWIHLACHAHQNVTDPTKSGFFLHDGTLDLAAINRRPASGNKGLAFLSACQTAMGDEKLPDEAIHLASGMLMAGYTSVIATMWSVVDDDAPVVADKVYAELMKEGKVGNGEAGRALHSAVGTLREKVGEKEFARWVPYIHIGS